MVRKRETGSNEAKDTKQARKDTVLVSLDPNDIKVDDALFGRANRTGVDEMKESIRSQGQLQPIAVRETDGGYTLVYGDRRLRAIQELNKESKNGKVLVRAEVLDVGEEQALVLAVHENAKRDEPNPLDDAHNFKTLVERFGRTIKEVASLVGQSETHVRSMLELLSLDTTSLNLVRRRVITASDAKQLLKVTDPEKRKAVVKAIENKHAQILEEQKKKIQKEQEEHEKKVKEREAAKASGKPVKGRVPAKESPKAGKLARGKTTVPTKEVSKAVSEVTEGAALVAPKIADVRDLFERMSGPAEPKTLKAIVEVMQNFLAGKVASDKAEAKIRKAAKTTDDLLARYVEEHGAFED